LAGVLLVVLPSVMYGGVALLNLLIRDPTYMAKPLRQNLWRAGLAAVRSHEKKRVCAWRRFALAVIP
jgi:hypothetical protein